MSEEVKPFRVYSNDFGFNVSHYDVVLEVKENIPGKQIVHGTISLSPQHAKAIAGLMNENIRKYEEIFGEIPTMTKEKLEELQKKGIVIQEGK